MRILFAAAAALSIVPATAHAQAPGVPIYETYPTGRAYRAAPHQYYTPPVYGYYQQGEPMYVAPQAVMPPDDCGEFHYWNGERCVDARWSPPDLR